MQNEAGGLPCSTPQAAALPSASATLSASHVRLARPTSLLSCRLQLRGAATMRRCSEATPGQKKDRGSIAVPGVELLLLLLLLLL